MTIRFTPQDGRLAPTKTDLGSLKFGHVIADGLLIPYAGTWLVQIDARYGDFKIVTFNGTIKISP